ncbi:MAG: hypothetical protein ACM3U2_21505, partial [Deltaproteobacteria bacterium]
MTFDDPHNVRAKLQRNPAQAILGTGSAVFVVNCSQYPFSPLDRFRRVVEGGAEAIAGDFLGKFA